jgi:hypothetical protein
MVTGDDDEDDEDDDDDDDEDNGNGATSDRINDDRDVDGGG